MSNISVSNEEIFISFAKLDLSKWENLKNAKVKNVSLGFCKFIKAELKKDDVNLFFEFAESGSIKKFCSSQFDLFFKIIEMPTGNFNFELIANQIRQQKEQIERLSKIESKYSGASHTIIPSSNLFPILEKLESNAKLEDSDFFWLMSNDQENLAVNALKNQSMLSNDPWELINASRTLRQWKRPKDALDLTANINSTDLKIKAAICTTRGAAYKDLQENDKALALAKKAIEFQPKAYYPYNLLGSLYFTMQEYEKGYLCYKKAIELGSPLHIQKNEINQYIETEADESKRTAAEFFLKQHSKKYYHSDN